MYKHRSQTFLPICITVMLIFLLAFPIRVFAEGEDPIVTPAATEAVTTQSTEIASVIQEATLPQSTETPVVTGTVATPEATPVSESTEIPVVTGAVSTTETATVTKEVVIPSTTENPIAGGDPAKIAEAVTTIQNTGAILVDANNVPIPLASNEAAAALIDPDPQGCPPGITPTWLGGTGAGCTINYVSIQAAVDDALVIDGWTIYIQTGTFTEDVDINKSITLKGSTGTTIQSPATIDQDFGNKKPIIHVYNNANVTLDNLIVDGANKGTANYSFIGIAFHNAGGTVTNSLIKNIMDTAFSGAQHGVGIYAHNEDGVARTLNITNNVIEDFQKTGMAFTGNGLTVNVEGNTVTGKGDTTITAQNGIQVSGGTTGTVKKNKVSNMRYTGSGWSASGILIQNSSGTVEVKDNEIKNAQSGIYVVDSKANLSGNTIEGADYGAIIMSYYVAKTASGTINNNTFKNNSLAVYTDNPDVTAHENKFGPNTDGFYYDNYWGVGGTLNAQYNYWGCDDGPNTSCGDTLYGSVNYTPWLTDPDHDLVFVSSDGTGGYKDNCPTVANTDQLDSDFDGVGNACDTTPFGPDKPATGGGTTGLIPVTGGQLVDLSCDIANTLSLANVSVEFGQTMCGYSAKISTESAGSLATALPAGYTFASGLTVNLFKGTESVQKLDSGNMTLQLPVPAGMEGKTLVILFWDAAAGKYVEVPGVIVAGGLVQVTVNQPGTYILVTK